MARQLWLLRHADAEPHGTRPDPERRLTRRGERQARLAGRALGRMGVAFQAVLSSPKERALRTAALALESWVQGASDAPMPPGLEVHAALGAAFDSGDALGALAALDADARLLAVGHEPDLSGVVAAFTGARIDLKKGGLAVVRLHSAVAVGATANGAQPVGETPVGARSARAAGELVLLLRPAELALIAGLAGVEL